MTEAVADRAGADQPSAQRRLKVLRLGTLCYWALRRMPGDQCLGINALMINAL